MTSQPLPVIGNEQIGGPWRKLNVDGLPDFDRPVLVAYQAFPPDGPFMMFYGRLSSIDVLYNAGGEQRRLNWEMLYWDGEVIRAERIYCYPYAWAYVDGSGVDA